MKSILLCGMPNTGKSTAFNGLTGGNAKVGNWHGVTTEKEDGYFHIGKEKYFVTDLPGLYSLYPSTLEEKTAVSALTDFNGLIVYLIEAANFADNLPILKALYNLGKTVLVVINMFSEFKKNGGKVQSEALKNFPYPYIFAELNTRKGIKLLKNAIVNYVKPKFNEYRQIFDSFSKVFISPEAKLSKADKLILNGKFFVFVFILSVFIVFYLAFGEYGLGKPLGRLIEYLICEKFAVFIEKFLKIKNVNEFLTLLTVNGIIKGVGGVFVFLPQILVLTMAVNIMELTGFLSRIAFMTDGVFNKVGLSGRAVFCLLMGFGCTSVAVASSGGLENNAMRKRAISAMTYCSCSAKIPVYAYLISKVNFRFPFAVLMLIYILGITFTFLQLKISKITIKGNTAPLVLEIPPYRIPPLRQMCKSLLNCVKQFIIKIGTVILIVSVTVCLLSSVNLKFEFVNGRVSESILATAGKTISFIFRPIGIDDWKITTAVLSGYFAKESIVSTLLSLGGEIKITEVSCIALLVFVLTTTPCFVALSTVKSSSGLKFTFIIAVCQFILSLLICYLTYFVIKNPLFIVVALSVTILAILYEKFHCRKKRKTIGVSP